MTTDDARPRHREREARPGARRVYLPQREWQELGGRRRRQVARNARRGRAHPDPHVAAVARAWAELVPQRGRPVGRRQRIRAVVSWLPTLALFAVAVVLQLDGSSVSTSTKVDDWRDQRLARRVLALPPPS